MTWHIDAILQKIAAKNLKQVVNIGAGFDSRPYRFGKQLPHVRFFELDQPATLSRKKEMVKAEFGELPTGVTYIPIDYRTQTIFDSLKRAGYDEKEKTLFIWEGALKSRFSISKSPKIVTVHRGAWSDALQTNSLSAFTGCCRWKASGAQT
jgi:methyltransferase (TIGR00027 family)